MTAPRSWRTLSLYEPRGNDVRDSSQRYSFEHFRPVEETRLETQDAAHDARILLARLGQRPPEGKTDLSAHPLFETVKDFCAEVTLNIKWYEEKREETQRLWYGLFALIVVLSCGGGLLMVALAHKWDSNLWLTFALGLTLPSLQAFTSAVDYKARLGAFWKASADLKELLFALEDTWRGRDLLTDLVTVEVNGTAVPKSFSRMLEECQATARRICRQERDAFFQTYKSPAELVDKLSNNFSAMRERGEFPRGPREYDPAANLKVAAEGVTKFIGGMPDPKARSESAAAAMKALQAAMDELGKHTRS